MHVLIYQACISGGWTKTQREQFRAFIVIDTDAKPVSVDIWTMIILLRYLHGKMKNISNRYESVFIYQYEQCPDLID